MEEEPTFEDLLVQLKNIDWWQRCEAVKMLGKRGDVKAVNPLIERLRDEDREVRIAVIESLEILGDKSVGKPLIQALADEDSLVKSTAFKAIGNLKIYQAVKPLLKILKGNISDVKGSAAWTLGELGDKRAIEPLTDIVEKDKVNTNRILEGKSLYSIISEQEMYDHMRGVAVQALGKIGDEQAVEPLIKVLETEKYQTLSMWAIEALGKIGDEQAVEPILKVLEDKKFLYKRYAVQALGNLGDDRAINPLLTLFNESETRNSTKNSVVEVLVKLNATDSIIQLLRDEDISKSRIVIAALKLEEIKDLRIIKLIMDSLLTVFWYEPFRIKMKAKLIESIKSIEKLNDKDFINDLKHWLEVEEDEHIYFLINLVLTKFENECV